MIYFFFSTAHFQQLLNQGVPMPVQTAAQIPFLVATYATIGESAGCSIICAGCGLICAGCGIICAGCGV